MFMAAGSETDRFQVCVSDRHIAVSTTQRRLDLIGRLGWVGPLTAQNFG